MTSLLIRTALALSMTLTSAGSSLAASCLRGINISGAEFGSADSVVNKDYTWPSTATLDYFAAKGFNSVRLPFRWERMQRQFMGPLDEAELSALMEAVELIRARKMRIILDPHNFGRYNEIPVGTPEVPKEAFADFWGKLAKLYANDDQVIFGLMNEPFKMPVDQWVDAANAATRAIREEAKANNLILVPGTAWTGAHSWMVPIDGEPNGVALKNFVDSGNNFAFEVHQYLDDDFSGTKETCSRGGDAVKALADFTGWLKSNGYRGMLGEFGGSKDPACISGLKGMVDVVEENKDVWIGWTYWVAGDWWSEAEALNIQPTKAGDRAQLQALLPALRDLSASGAACPSLD